MTVAPAPEVDGAALRAALTAAARTHGGDGAATRAEALAILKQVLWTARTDARVWLDAGADGLRVARFLSVAADMVIGALHDFTTTHVIRASNPTEGERFALVAVGGYGRGALAPYSDVDVLMLRAWKLTPHTESAAEFILYALWDLGLKVGWAARSVEECLRAAREDSTVRTGLLEARWLAGDRDLPDVLAKRLRAEVVKGTEAAFVAEKLAERDARHAKAGASRYLVEPDVKNGKGALRDLHTLFWIARYVRPDTVSTEDAASRMFIDEERRAFGRAFRFLWTVRCRLHFAAGRAEERLGFEHQAQIAKEMGFRDRRGERGVERFMRRYFLAAREAGALTRTLCARLEAEQALSKSRGLSRFLRRPRFRLPLRDGAFGERRGRLTLRRPDAFVRRPADLIRMFAVADRQNLDLSPEAFEAARRSGRLAARAREDPAAQRMFVRLLAESGDPQGLLGLMNDAGVLGRFLPEFGRIVARTQFNMFHAYTVDEHTLRAVGVMRSIADRTAGAESGAPEAFAALADPEVVFLAMLLHDVGKGSGEAQEIAGARFARTACLRLGLSEARADEAAWLVGHHLLMSDVAQKRDLSDPETVRVFASTVGNLERLRGLLAVTVADIQAVGPGVWNGWKARLLAELYAATAAELGAGQRPADATAAARAAFAAVSPEAGAWLDTMDEAYFAAFSPDEQTTHAGMAASAMNATAISAIDATMLAIIATDRLGLFADLTGAIAGQGAGVIGARAHTTPDGRAMDVFHLQDGAGGAFGAGRPGVLRRLEAAVTAAALGEAPFRPVASRPSVRAQAFVVPASVSVELLGPERGLRLEAAGADRPGLLAELAAAVARARLSIRSAHVDTLGERAVDVLYLQSADGALIRPGQLSRLRAAVMTVLEPQAAARTATELSARASTSPRSSRATAATSASG